MKQKCESDWKERSELKYSVTAFSVQIRSYLWSVFSCIRTEYGDLRVNLRIQSEYRKIRTRKSLVSFKFTITSAIFRTSEFYLKYETACLRELFYHFQRY